MSETNRFRTETFEQNIFGRIRTIATRKRSEAEVLNHQNEDSWLRRARPVATPRARRDGKYYQRGSDDRNDDGVRSKT